VTSVGRDDMRCDFDSLELRADAIPALAVEICSLQKWQAGYDLGPGLRPPVPLGVLASHTRETSPRQCAHPKTRRCIALATGRAARRSASPPARDGDRPSSGRLGRRSACRPHLANLPTLQPHDGHPPRASIHRRVESVPHSSPTRRACRR
jgi:hypothetical protein